ncbi:MULTISPECIES: fimbria/pilus outer membrane usher protein [Providencia]|uniref:fimbria/pilus outer membrane usher protein n=1 Tax=Providencia TaxID=586 RepID=UPI001B37A7F7|nr:MULTISPECIES: fimbria/pilus outer membrane usher protein [Providencia]ELR5295213.1 fimbrial biogenesis outer membrane usher protein [Providencia rettgeri]MBQ0398912.1 fimbrial biogenesis outer membrane usher protein [Providencia rettgeri]MCG5380022.1 fimbrial biogenesis outer membrane usher protein [Providencia rettgeri]MCG9941415.1 fimbrial biogenesis outer membrane usher protein [Providencia rettgeri]MCK9999955.1 fimbrial biogenesis outer membrane usher protein [Providencia rettgeri]
MYFKKKNICYIISLLVCGGYSNAETFNINALNLSVDDNIDLSYFEKNNFSEGLYETDIVLNGKRILRGEKIKFISHDGIIEPCITASVIKRFPLTEDAKEILLSSEEDHCINISALDKNVTVDFNDSDQVLTISIPQKYLVAVYSSWISPELRDYGIAGLILDYTVSDNNFYRKDSGNRNNLSAFGNVGANLAEWRLRANYQYENKLVDSSNDKKSRFEWEQIYAFRDMASLSAKLFVGEIYIKSDLFDSVRFKGISVFTDESMMPPNLRGYAPQITGVAASNATVTLSQNGRIISQIKVPAGPFVIKDLSQSVMGTIDVTVIEDNGKETRFQYTTTNIPFLTRKGQVRYTMNLGQLSPENNENIDKNFITVESSIGVLNNTSVFGGLVATSNNQYRAINLGVGQNLGFLGALSIDVTQSYADVGTRETGKSYRINYAKNLPSIDGQLTLTGYRFADRTFNSLSNFVEKNFSDNSQGELDKDKHVFSLSYAQQLHFMNASANITASRKTYWNGKQNNYFSIGLNKFFDEGIMKGGSVSLSLNQSRNSRDKTDNQIYLSVSRPLQTESQNASISYFASYSDQDKRYTNNVNYSNYVNKDTNYNLTASTQDGLSQGSVNAFISHSGDTGQLQMSGALSDSMNSASIMVSGSITATQHGISAHRLTYRDQSRLVVDVPKAKGVIIENSHAITNDLGLATISNVPTYYNMEYKVDVNNLPDTVNVEDNVLETALTDGAIGYIKMDADIGKSLISRIKLANGQYPPLGAVVTNTSNNKVSGIIAESGIVYLTGLNMGDQLSINWGEGKSCSFSADSILVKSSDAIMCNQ